jgi:hypothetical protein
VVTSLSANAHDDPLKYFLPDVAGSIACPFKITSSISPRGFAAGSVKPLPVTQFPGGRYSPSAGRCRRCGQECESLLHALRRILVKLQSARKNNIKRLDEMQVFSYQRPVVKQNKLSGWKI